MTLLSPHTHAGMSAAGSRPKLLVLYRQLLRSAKSYPSKKRDSIYAEIREAFRENRSLASDSPKAFAAVQEAD